MTTNFFVHASAIVEEGAIIGEGTKIWHFSHIMPLTVIGERCILGQNTFVDNNVVIGNDVKIQNNVSVYTGVEVEDDVFIGPSVVFTNVLNPRSLISRKNEFKRTLVKKGASIGANATLVCGIELGGYCLVGAGAVVTKSVPAFAVVTGNPAKQTGWISEQGYKLLFDKAGEAICSGDRQAYVLKNNVVAKL